MRAFLQKWCACLAKIPICWITKGWRRISPLWRTPGVSLPMGALCFSCVHFVESPSWSKLIQEHVLFPYLISQHITAARWFFSQRGRPNPQVHRPTSQVCLDWGMLPTAWTSNWGGVRDIHQQAILEIEDQWTPKIPRHQFHFFPRFSLAFPLALVEFLRQMRATPELRPTWHRARQAASHGAQLRLDFFFLVLKTGFRWVIHGFFRFNVLFKKCNS